MLSALFGWMIRPAAIIPPADDERQAARRIRSQRQRQSYADRRAAECRAARLRMTGEQA
ncbi:hypothetical protein [Sphingomonas sp. Leaf10]|uniref:hypothetical protein n=1 Tax=Sphingomonas sp. Leaf10 TaxID=1735676 RepID=UPI000ADDB17F|nr:hypothetical protein [Sphingomonas sp. Leaf10]